MDKLAKNKTEYPSSDTDMNQIVTYDDSDATGEYYTLDNSWTEIPNYKSDRYRIGVGLSFKDKEVRIFSCLNNNTNIITLDNKYTLFDRKDWIELRRKRGDNKYKPFNVDRNGTIWIGEKQNGTSYRVYIKC